MRTSSWVRFYFRGTAPSGRGSVRLVIVPGRLPANTALAPAHELDQVPRLGRAHFRLNLRQRFLQLQPRPVKQLIRLLQRTHAGRLESRAPQPDDVQPLRLDVVPRIQ